MCVTVYVCVCVATWLITQPCQIIETTTVVHTHTHTLNQLTKYMNKHNQSTVSLLTMLSLPLLFYMYVCTIHCKVEGEPEYEANQQSSQTHEALSSHANTHFVLIFTQCMPSSTMPAIFVHVYIAIYNYI